jgi:oxygen-independent coproporphyrinogen-3 oxidase
MSSKEISSLYIHVPFCRHLCNYCDFYKRKFDEPTRQLREFESALREGFFKQQELLESNGFRWAPLESVYLGGGTPSLWGASGAEAFQDIIRIPQSKRCEFTMEIDPGTWTPELIGTWKSIGLNRISIGTQSLNPEFLKVLDRPHSIEESHKLLEYCHQKDWNFSLDFLLGVPYSKQKHRNIQRELDELLSYKPKHISLYILNARSKYPHITQMPDDSYTRDEFLFVSEYLRAQGFHHYEVSNFALPGYESFHNKKYWRSESVAALGPTGTGFLKLETSKALRYKWKASSADYELEDLGPEELDLEEMYLALRTSEGWKPEKLTPKLSALFQEWQQKALGEFTQGRMILNSQGFVILDSLIDDIFRISAT